MRYLAARLRAPVCLIFFVLGITAGSWAARIPAVTGGLHLSPAVLGVVLLGPAAGSVLAIPAVGAVLATAPARRVIQACVLPAGALLVATTVAHSAWQLFAILATWGAAVGAVDVAMNTAGLQVQDRLGRRVMSTFHGCFSVGGLAGAGMSAIAAAVGISPRINFAIAAIIVVLAGEVSAHALADTGARSARQPRVRSARRPRWSWSLVALAVMAFSSFLCEGSADSWSAIYLHSSLGAGPGIAAVAYVAFSCTMAGGRFAGDRLADLAGPVRLIRLATGTAAVVFATSLLVGTTWLGLLGFATLGAGLSFVVPLVIAAASELGDPPGPNVAFVSSSGYFGMLVGPPVIGLAASASTLSAALGITAGLTGLIAVLAGNVRPAPRSRADELSVPDPGPPPAARGG